MAEIFDVQYNIDVFSSSAVQGINKFVNAVDRLSEVSTKLQNFQTTLRNIETMSTKGLALNIKTDVALKRLERVYNKLGQIKNTAAKINLGVQGGVAGRGTKKTSANAAQSVTAPMTTPTTKQHRPKTFMKSKAGTPLIPNNLEYQVLGPTRLGNVAMLDMFKGMGIMYGISAIGSGIRDIITTSAEYQNVMQTAKNILKTNYTGRNFNASFANMEAIARQVGVETKFTAPEVADAVKFLAMAGLDIDAISKSIRPIADIALIGDTDLGTTADVMTNIMTGYDILPENMRKTADIMTRTFTMSNTTLMEMAESFKMAAPLLNLNKVPFETAAAMIGVLGDAGVKGTMAGTTIRTIMNNLMNPTKKQQKEWERLGIRIKDDNGNLRNLNDIFYELNERRLGGENVDIYKLFRLTAASGAGALMQHVDKWNQMIEQNFLSAGLSDKLAEEKKNQVTGLWAQLKSAFQETGLQVFEENDSKIKSYLGKGINWLKSGEFKDALRNLIDLVTSLGEKLVEFTKFIFDLYQKFEPLVKLFLNSQLYLKAFQVILGGIKQVGNSALYALTPLFNAISLTGWTSLGRFSKAHVAEGTAANGTAIASMNPILAWWSAGGKRWDSDVFARLREKGNDPTKALFADKRFHKARKGTDQYNLNRIIANQYVDASRKIARRDAMAQRMNAWGGAAQVAGMFAGYQLGSLIDPEGNGAMIGSLAGSMALPLAMAIPGAPFILGAAAALGGVVLAVRRYNENVGRAKTATENWKSSFDDLGISKIDVTKPDAALLKNMDIISSKILDQNQKIELQIQLWNELAKAKKGENNEDYSQTPLVGRPGMEDVKAISESVEKLLGRSKSFKILLNTLAGNEEEGIPGAQIIEANGGLQYDRRTQKFSYMGRSFFANANTPFNLEAVYAAEALDNYHVAEAKNWLANTMYRATSPETFQKRVEGFWNNPKFAPNIDDLKKIRTDQRFSKIGDEILTYPSYGYIIQRREQELLDQYNSYLAVLEAIESGAGDLNTLTQAVFANSSMFMDAQYGLFGSQEWIDKIKEFGISQEWGEEDFNNAISEEYKRLLETFNKIAPEVQPYFYRMLNKSVWESIYNGIDLSEINGGFYRSFNDNMFPYGEDKTWDDVRGYWLDNGNVYYPWKNRTLRRVPPTISAIEDEQQSLSDSLISYNPTSILPDGNQEDFRPRERRQERGYGNYIAINLYPGNMLHVDNINGVTDPEEFAEISVGMIAQKLIDISNDGSLMANTYNG